MENLSVEQLVRKLQQAGEDGSPFVFLKNCHVAVQNCSIYIIGEDGTGEDKASAPAANNTPETEHAAENVSLRKWLFSKSRLNQLCYDMLEACGSGISPKEEILCLTFLQLCLRYLAMGFDEEDQHLISLRKLAKCTEKKYELTTFDVLMTDVLQYDNTEQNHQVPNHQEGDSILLGCFYHRFKQLETEDTFGILMRLVDLIETHWPQTQG